MKTININKKAKKIYDPVTKKYMGFVGNVKIYNKTIYIDTRDGTGYDKAISLLEKHINRLSYKYNLSSFGFCQEDTRQHIVLRILEGIPKYDPDNKMSLSTFLYMRVERLIINEIRNASIGTKNPTVLKTSLYSVFCKCGNKFMLGLGKENDIESVKCYACEDTLENSKIYHVNVPPESIDCLPSIKDIKEDNKVYLFDDFISDDNVYIQMVFGKKRSLEEDVTLKHDLEKWIDKEDDKRVKKLVELICFKDYSLKDASKVIGMSHTWAKYTLENLKKKKIICDLLDR